MGRKSGTATVTAQQQQVPVCQLCFFFCQLVFLHNIKSVLPLVRPGKLIPGTHEEPLLGEHHSMLWLGQQCMAHVEI